MATAIEYGLIGALVMVVGIGAWSVTKDEVGFSAKAEAAGVPQEPKGPPTFDANGEKIYYSLPLAQKECELGVWQRQRHFGSAPTYRCVTEIEAPE
ncbi:MAG: hypothetical protein ABA06_01740 [Parcubacteria bacterium C7867-001]|nr:MAG: hypothetical protein ABA06_01740 [Parcubacteria bacterium C7867-001]